MRPIARITAFAVASLLPTALQAATVSGEEYATQYDYREFYTAADNRNFLVVVKGTPFPGLSPDEGARRLLPVLQAAKPPPRLTFTYNQPAEAQHPDYRMFLVFDPADDLGSDSVCKGAERHKAPSSGRITVYGVYCRNGTAMSEAMGRTDASSPDAPDVLALYKSLMRGVFNDSELLRPEHKGGIFR